jgi:hypothetical protein
LAFKTAKAVVAKEAFLQYPDHNQPFHVYADASDFQLGSETVQEGKPVAFFSFSEAQHGSTPLHHR